MTSIRHMLRGILLVGLIVWVMSLLPSCNKSTFLGKQPNTDSLAPSTLSDFQALMDNTTVLNGTPLLGEQSADNYVLDYGTWSRLQPWEQNTYTWAANTYAGEGTVADWNNPYSQVLYANVTLEGLSGLKTDSIRNDSTWRAIKGQALFARAFAFWNVAQVFAKPYDAGTAGTDLGIPLRLSADINMASVRATVAATYDRILTDLMTAVRLLPLDIELAHLNRPMRPAAYAMLARVYLSMRDYSKALLYADSCLQLYDSLLDYKTELSGIASFPFTATNKEIIYANNFTQNSSQILFGLVNSAVLADSALYYSYDTNDLRLKAFFRNTGAIRSYRAGYNGNIAPFSGLATDEVLLMRAECRVRTGQVSEGVDDLNRLLKMRWKDSSYVALNITDRDVALDSVLVHRRKELPMRGLRWMDLRRFNKEGMNIVLTRNLNGNVYTLTPNSNLYVLPIPPDVLSLSNLMVDNPRP